MFNIERELVDKITFRMPLIAEALEKDESSRSGKTWQWLKNPEQMKTSSFIKKLKMLGPEGIKNDVNGSRSIPAYFK